MRLLLNRSTSWRREKQPAGQGARKRPGLTDYYCPTDLRADGVTDRERLRLNVTLAPEYCRCRHRHGRRRRVFGGKQFDADVIAPFLQGNNVRRDHWLRTPADVDAAVTRIDGQSSSPIGRIHADVEVVTGLPDRDVVHFGPGGNPDRLFDGRRAAAFAHTRGTHGRFFRLAFHVVFDVVATAHDDRGGVTSATTDITVVHCVFAADAPVFFFGRRSAFLSVVEDDLRPMADGHGLLARTLDRPKVRPDGLNLCQGNLGTTGVSTEAFRVVLEGQGPGLGVTPLGSLDLYMPTKSVRGRFGLNTVGVLSDLYQLPPALLANVRMRMGNTDTPSPHHGEVLAYKRGLHAGESVADTKVDAKRRGAVALVAFVFKRDVLVHEHGFSPERHGFEVIPVVERALLKFAMNQRLLESTPFGLIQASALLSKNTVRREHVFDELIATFLTSVGNARKEGISPQVGPSCRGGSGQRSENHPDHSGQDDEDSELAHGNHLPFVCDRIKYSAPGDQSDAVVHSQSKLHSLSRTAWRRTCHQTALLKSS